MLAARRTLLSFTTHVGWPWQCGGERLASTKASRAARRKKTKNRFNYTRVPQRLLHQNDGDFPVQLRPMKPPELRDLQDAELDAEAAEDRSASKLKPHKVREVLQGQGPRPNQDNNITVSRLKDHQRLLASRVPDFDVEKDLKEEDASALAAEKARQLARRNYKWMPNPYSSKPGPLGRDPEAEAKYYSRYYEGERPFQDKGPPVGSGATEEFREAARPRPKRERISPKRFWYRSDYVTPDPATVAYMGSRDLKYAMVNEAHLVRKWRSTHPDGRAAGMPPDSSELWMAFGHRAADLAQGRPRQTVRQNQDEVEHPILQQCSVSTSLRFLQALASVQAGPYSALQRVVSRIIQHLPELKPVEGFYLLQALARLRLRHQKINMILERMHLTWTVLPAKQLVKAANAAAKLDVAIGMWARPLKAALVAALPRLSAKHLAALKSITVMELLDHPSALTTYLEECERNRSWFWYSRHLHVVELHVHLLHPEVWQSLPEHIRLFLEEVRTAAEKSRLAAEPDVSDKDRGGRNDAIDSDSDEESEQRRRSFDPRIFSSEMHLNVSQILRESVGIEHNNRLAAGPLTLDICHLPTMTAIEVAAPWQFYLRSPRVTALARRRQEMLRAMGFKLVIVPYHRWFRLETDDAKADFLRGAVSAEMLAHARIEQLAT